MDRVKFGASVFLVLGMAFGGAFLLSVADVGTPIREPAGERGEHVDPDAADGGGLGPYGSNLTPADIKGGGSTLNFEDVYPDQEIPEQPWFEEVSGELGLDYYDSGDQYFEGESVSGVFVADVNRDHRDDILTIGGESPVLHENTADGFVDVREFDGVSNTTSALFFDQDNDGYPELYLLSDERSVFYDNDGGVYRERDVGLPEDYASVRGASAADYTDDGCLDVFVVQAGDWTDRRPAGYDSRNVSIDGDNGEPNRLFSGDCEGFTETTSEVGVEGDAWSLASSFVDFTGDGLPDIHVANDFNNDVLYLNQGNGTFERRVLSNSTNRNGMSSEVADVNGDGLLDIFVTNVHFGVDEGAAAQRFGGRVEGNNLLLNQGNGSFVDAAEEYGVRKGGWGWSAVFADFTLDGELDLVHSVSAILDRPALWVGGSDEYTWVDSEAAGLKPSRGYGLADLDIDADGAPDLVVSNRGGGRYNSSRHQLYRNLADGGSLRVVVDDVSRGTDYGAVVRVTHDGETQTRVKHSRSDYMSQSARAMSFGVGDAESVDVEVEWPDGRVDTHTDVEVGGTVSLYRGGIEGV